MDFCSLLASTKCQSQGFLRERIFFREIFTLSSKGSNPWILKYFSNLLQGLRHRLFKRPPIFHQGFKSSYFFAVSLSSIRILNHCFLGIQRTYPCNWVILKEIFNQNIKCFSYFQTKGINRWFFAAFFWSLPKADNDGI